MLSIFAYRSAVFEFNVISLFNTQPNRPRAFRASFKHMGQVPYPRGFKFGEMGPIKILVHFSYRLACLNFIKILSLFNKQPNRPRASPESFKHVGQAHYSRGLKFGENGMVKVLVHFCLQVSGG